MCLYLLFCGSTLTASGMHHVLSHVLVHVLWHSVTQAKKSLPARCYENAAWLPQKIVIKSLHIPIGAVLFSTLPTQDKYSVTMV